jgi:hypothetical protein
MAIQHQLDKETNNVNTAGVSRLLSAGNGQMANICASASFLWSTKISRSGQMCVHIAFSWKSLKRGSAIFCAHRQTQHTEWPLLPLRQFLDHLETSIFINSSQKNEGPYLERMPHDTWMRRRRRIWLWWRWWWYAISCISLLCDFWSGRQHRCLEVVQVTDDWYLRKNQRIYFIILFFLLFCTMTNKCIIISQIITLLHVSTLSCHPQTACNQYLAKLHKYFKCSCR